MRSFLICCLLLAACRGAPLVTVIKDDAGADSGVETVHLCSLDVVFIVDFSSSMDVFLPQVRAEIENQPGNYRFALIGAPDSKPEHDTQVQVMRNFTTLDKLKMVTRSAQFEPTGGNHEPTLDALALVLDPANPLELSWSFNDRRIILFTDEVPQSFTTPFMRGLYLPDGPVRIFTEKQYAWEKEVPQYPLPFNIGYPLILDCP